MTTTIKTKTFEQLIVTIGLLCCISFYLSDNQILWNKKQQSTDHHLVNSQFRLLTLPLSSNECVNCNHRSKRSTYKSPAISSSGITINPVQQSTLFLSLIDCCINPFNHHYNDTLIVTITYTISSE